MTIEQLDLANRVALVTGGGRGIGRSISLALAERGAEVIVNCFHSLDRARETVGEIEALGGKARFIRASVEKSAQLDRMFTEIADTIGRLDILINNAARGPITPIEDLSSTDIVRALQTNAVAPWDISLRAAALMPPGSTIVNISSIGSNLVPAQYVAVGASKAALEAFTRYLAAHLARTGIRVNTASAGLILEESAAQSMPELDQIIAVTEWATPMGRAGRHSDLVGVVNFLTSELSSWVTGQVVLADGGLSLGVGSVTPPSAMPRPYPGLSTTNEAAHLASDPDIAPNDDPGVRCLSTAPGTSANGEANVIAPIKPNRQYASDDIVIVGTGLVVPGADDVDVYWQNASRGKEIFCEPPTDRWHGPSFIATNDSSTDKAYQSKSGFIVGHVHRSPNTCTLDDGPIADITTCWLRHSVIQATKDIATNGGCRFGVFVGFTADGSQQLDDSLVGYGFEAVARNSCQLSESEIDRFADQLREAYPLVTRSPHNSLPHRIGQRIVEGVLPTDSEIVMVDTACSSSLYSIDLGVKALRQHQVDLAVCGGAFSVAARGSVLFSKLNGLSPSGIVRSLDGQADGVLFSDGAAIVTMKRLADAVRDRDTVLAVLRGIGTSSDGKGKAVYAPSSKGQKLAVRRALEDGEIDAADVDWIHAHSTGTPAGDAAEIATIRDCYRSRRTLHVTSNKSIIGHTGWAAGAVSLIEVVQALRHEEIPAQHRFRAAPPSFEITDSNLSISSEPQPWPARKSGPRRAAVSGFGFGGTNAHAIIEEFDGNLPIANRSEPSRQIESLALVGVAFEMPGLDEADMGRWVAGEISPRVSWGHDYPQPTPGRFRLPPPVLRSLDRTQLIALELAESLVGALSDRLDNVRTGVGVVLGHVGPTRNAAHLALRCHLDDLKRRLENSGGLDESIHRLLGGEVETLVAESTEDSFPGSMPNVIAGRIANYFDLNGPALTVDAGLDSMAAALATSARYLADGSADIVFAGALSANVSNAFRRLVSECPDLPDEIREGAVLFAVTTPETAARLDLDVKAALELAPATPSQRVPTSNDPYLAAADGVTLLHGLHARSTTTIGDGVWHATLHCSDRASAYSSPSLTTAESDIVERSVVQQRDELLKHVREPYDLLTEPCLLLGTDIEVLTSMALHAPAARVLVVGTGADSLSALPNTVESVAEVSQASIANALNRMGPSCGRLIVVDRLDGHDSLADARTLDLHTAAFVCIKELARPLASSGSFLGALLIHATPFEAHSDAGLYEGLLKAAKLELEPEKTLCLITDFESKAALEVLMEESGAQHGLPVVMRSRSGERRGTCLVRETLARTVPVPFDEHSVVVAVGGSRGITAQCLFALARRVQPSFVILGSNEIRNWPEVLLSAPLEAHLASKGDVIKQRLAAGDSSRKAIRYFERLTQARETRSVLAELERRVGPGKVHYLTADVTNRHEVERAMTWVQQHYPAIDLLIHAAGVNRSRSIESKSVEDFCTVRDVKVLGYRHLVTALAGFAPRIWCNFGSVLGYSGQAGELDYASANGFLLAASRVARSGAESEQTICWPLWQGAGLGDDPLMAEYFERNSMYTFMPSEEGVQHFINELAHVPRHSAPIYFGDRERETFSQHLPEAFGIDSTSDTTDAGNSVSVAAAPLRFRYPRRFTLDSDPYLAMHIVNGVPTLPGAFVLQLAADAAASQVPNLVVTEFRNIEFRRFIKVFGPARSTDVTVVAELLDRSQHEATVAIEIVGDTITPGGVVLSRDRPFASLIVHLADDYRSAPPVSNQGHSERYQIAIDPYHIENPAVLLTEMFVCTSEAKTNDRGGWATFSPSHSIRHSVIGNFSVPSLMLDALARTVALRNDAEEGHALLVPSAIDSVILYEGGNDVDLVDRYGILTLHAEMASDKSRCVALRPDGFAVAEIAGMIGVPMGWIDSKSGQFNSRR